MGRRSEIHAPVQAMFLSFPVAAISIYHRVNDLAPALSQLRSIPGSTKQDAATGYGGLWWQLRGSGEVVLRRK